MNREFLDLYFKSLLVSNNINIKETTVEEYSAVASHINSKMDFVEWFKNYTELDNIKAMLEEGLENLEDPIPTTEEKMEKNQKLMGMLPSTARAQLKETPKEETK